MENFLRGAVVYLFFPSMEFFDGVVHWILLVRQLWINVSCLLLVRKALKSANLLM